MQVVGPAGLPRHQDADPEGAVALVDQGGGAGDRDEGAVRLQRAALYLKSNGTYHWEPHPIAKNVHMRAALDQAQDGYFAAAHSITAWRYDHGLLRYVDPEVPPDDADSRPIPANVSVNQLTASEGPS